MAEQEYNYSYIGCYRDTWTRALSCNAGLYYYDIDECRLECISYKYFALQYGTECWCENCLNDAIQYGTADGDCGDDGLGGIFSFDLYQNSHCMSIYHCIFFIHC